MEREDPVRTDRGAAPCPATPARGRRLYRVGAAVLAAVACGVALVLFLRVPPPNGQAQDGLPMFAGWEKPEVALLLSGQQHGYLQPCGCSEPQFGGLVRRYNFLQSLKDKGWPVVAVDLGDIPDLPKRTSPQTLLKYITSMKALKLMDYSAVTFGPTEMSLPLHEALNSYALNHPEPPVLGTNLKTREKADDPFHETVKAWAVGGKGDTPKVGVLALMAPSVEKDVKDPDVKLYRDTRKVLEKALGELKAQQAQLVVLLYQGTVEEARTCARFCADRHKADPDFPAVNAILRLDEENPAGVPEMVGDSMIVGVGHKGRYVGVIGAYRSTKASHAWQLKYQLVQLGPEWKTPAAREAGHPIMELIEDYATEVKQGKFLDQYRQKKHPVQLAFKGADYVGSDDCKGCHADAWKKWKESRHFHAYKTLENATNPRHRQYDGECVVCHVVGFGIEGGFKNETKTPHLKNVGCESCHGPCSEHVANTKNMEVRWAINPYKARPNESAQARVRRMNQIDMFCQSCHDIDNDVHWQFQPKWDKIIHMTPRNGK